MDKIDAVTGGGRPVMGPDRFLDRATLDRMHGAAVEMIVKTGILVEHEPIRNEIVRHAGFRMENGRVLVAPGKIEATLARMRKTARPAPKRDPRTPFTLGVDDRASYIVDRDGTTLRPMTRQDSIDSAKLVTMLGPRGVRGSSTGVAMDIPAPLRPLEQFMIGAEFSPAGGGTSEVLDIPTAEVLRDMNRACGRGFGRSVWNLSPLILGGSELDILWHFRDEVEDIYVGSMPIMGMTGPCDPIGVFTLGMAECLGNACIIRELFPKADVRAYPHPEPADMASGVMVFGTPEWDIIDLMHRDVHEYYGTRTDQKLIHTTASLPGVQAVTDHAGSMMLGALHGLTQFSPGGMLALDEVYSPALLVLDAEMLAHTWRIVQGAWSGEGLGMGDLPGVVAEVIREGGTFADHETTVANMREQYHQPAVLKRQNRAQWEAAGRPGEVARAQAEADRLIASFNYQPDQGMMKELRGVYERGKKKLGF